MIRVVLVSKALVDSAYRAKAELIGAEADIDLTVIVPATWREGGRAMAPAPRGVDYALIPTRVRRPGDFHLHWLPDLGPLLARLAPDVVHVDDEPYNHVTWRAMRAARAAGARTVFFAWQNLARGVPLPFRWLERSVLRSADGAIAGTESAAHVLRHKGFWGPLWVLPQFGVDEARFQPAPTEEDPVGQADVSASAAAQAGVSASAAARADVSARVRPLTVGYVGRLVPEKGVDVLVQALAGLEHPWRLEIAGDGPARAELTRLLDTLSRSGVPEPLSDRVRFHGWLTGEKLPDFYHHLDVLVLPSRATRRWEEQFGRVLVEAMACGIPCIGAHTGEIPGVLGDAGLTFPDGDALALRAALAALATDRQLREDLAARGRARILEHFTMRRVAAESAAIYRTVAKRGEKATGARLY